MTQKCNILIVKVFFIGLVFVIGLVRFIALIFRVNVFSYMGFETDFSVCVSTSSGWRATI